MLANYFNILSKAWTISWNNKRLWWIGFVLFSSALLLGLSPDFDKSDFRAINIFLAIASLIIVGLRFWGLAALLVGLRDIVQKKSRTIPEISHEAKTRWIRIMGVWAITNLSLFFVLFVLYAPLQLLMNVGTKPLSTTAMILAATIFIPISVIAAYMERYGYFFVIFSNFSPIMALENGYYVFKKNIRKSILMSIFMGICALVIATMFLLALLLLIFISMVPGLILYGIFGTIGFVSFGMIVGLIALSLLLIFGSMLYTLFYAAWVTFFFEIAAVQTKEKVAETTEKESLSAEKSVPSSEQA